MGRLLVAVAAIFLLGITARSSDAARLGDGFHLISVAAGEGDDAAALNLMPEEEDFYRDVVVDNVRLTSVVAVDPYDEGARDHLHHHGHVRNLQNDALFRNDCEGIPSRFQSALYITLNDIDGKLDEQYEFDILIEELEYTLKKCSGSCVTVEEINILAQFFFADRRRRRRNGRRWWRRNVVKVYTGGSCFQCSDGQKVELVNDSMTRVRRLGGAAETGERRLQESCGDLLSRRLKRHGLEAFECMTVAELSVTDPRCEIIELGNEIEEIPGRRLIENPEDTFQDVDGDIALDSL